MNTTTQTPAAREEAYFAQIEGTRDAVENFGRAEHSTTFDAYEIADSLHRLRSAALQGNATQLQEMKMHKDLTRLVRQAEKLQAEVDSFNAKMKAVENAIYAKY